VGGAGGLWLAVAPPPAAALPLVEGCPDRAKARAAPPAPSRMATARTTVSRTGRRTPDRWGPGRDAGPGRDGGSGGDDHPGRDGGSGRDGGVAPGGGAAGRGPAGCQVWASTVWVGLPDPAAGSAAVRVSWASSSAAVGRARGSWSRAAA